MVKIKKCIICEREYKVYDNNKISHGSRTKSKRMRTSLTCSKKCSKSYVRIRKHIMSCYYQNNGHQKRENQMTPKTPSHEPSGAELGTDATFNLSEKITDDGFYIEEDVKEFIRLLKDEITFEFIKAPTQTEEQDRILKCLKRDIFWKINKLAGEKII